MSTTPEYVSEGPTRGTLSMGRMFLVWLAANLVVTTLLTGTIFVPGVTLAQALTWIVVGTALGTCVLTLVAVMGTRTGLSTMALTRGSFGVKGSVIPSLSNVFVLMGWSWVQAMLAGISVNWLVARATGFDAPVLWCAICEAIVVALAIFGHTAIAKIEPWLGLLTLSLMAYVFYVAFTRHQPVDYATLPADASLGIGPTGVFDIVFATAISWTVMSADLTRDAKTQKAGAVGAGLGYGLSTFLAMSLGATAIAFVVLEGGEPVAFDPVLVIEAFGPVIAVVFFLSVMATNTMAVYGMTLSLQHAFATRKPLPFAKTALGLGVVSVAGSTWLAMLDKFTDFLATIGALFIPVFAVMIIDYYFFKRASYSIDILQVNGGEYWYRNGVNWAAVITWLLGAGTYLLLAFVLSTPVGAALPTLAVSALLYLSLAKAFGLKRQRTHEHAHLSDLLEQEGIATE